MRVQFYKPNAKVTGSACSFWTSDDGSIMSSLIKQDSWDDSRKRGSFSKNKDNPRKKVIIKLNATEAGSIIDVLENNRKWSGYHQSKNQITKINFGPYERNGEQVGFSYSVNKEEKEDSTNKASFIIGFTFGEGVLLREALIEAVKNFLNSSGESFVPKNRPEEQPPRAQKKEEAAGQSLDDADMW